MTKRPSLIANLSLPAGDDEPETPAAAPEQDSPTPVKRKPRPDIVHTSVYIPKPVYQKLREIAFTTDCMVHDVIMEGIDAALRKYGHPSVNALKGGPMKKGKE